MPDTTKPSAPTNLIAAATASKVDLTWGTSGDDVAVTGYNIYRDGSPIASVGVTTSYSDTSVTAPGYSYTVKAFDAVGGRPTAPMGVVGQIVPWNFPLLMAAWKLAPALACGNAAILKPAETTPLTALLLAEICQEAELPAGVVAILPGDGVTGAALVRSEGIDKLAFTGSTAVGRDIQSALAGREVGLTLELGGKSANIVFEDAALTRPWRGSSTGSSSTRATCAARARGC